MTSTEQPEFATLDLDELRSAGYEPAGVGVECVLCGKVMSEAAASRGWWVHLIDGDLLASTRLGMVEPSEDMGWFPVGPECARRVPASFRVRNAP